MENIETDEHFITTVIDSVSVPAYGILSQCQLRHRKLEELIDEYEKELRSFESTEATETNDELTVSNASDIEEEDAEYDEEEAMEENDEGIEDDDDSDGRRQQLIGQSGEADRGQGCDHQQAKCTDRRP